jgi:hypothetical protein
MSAAAATIDRCCAHLDRPAASFVTFSAPRPPHIVGCATISSRRRADGWCRRALCHCRVCARAPRSETELKTIGSAAFWTTTQLLTVSSSIANPLSVGGRVLDIFMEAYAITVIATLAGAIGSFLQKRGEEIDAHR